MYEVNLVGGGYILVLRFKNIGCGFALVFLFELKFSLQLYVELSGRVLTKIYMIVDVE
jgi:hypothetical protein